MVARVTLKIELGLIPSLFRSSSPGWFQWERNSACNGNSCAAVHSRALVASCGRAQTCRRTRFGFLILNAET